MPSRLILRNLGQRQIAPVLAAMRSYTDTRGSEGNDELWALEHPPVYTLGQAGKREHVIADIGTVPLVKTDRGGQVTYHGPGQLVVYVLLDLRRLEIGVRALVRALEASLINLLKGYDVDAFARPDAPGVYVDGDKIAALGLRVRHGCTYHGLSLNVSMDLMPFNCINPCGYPQLAVTQLRDLGIVTTLRSVTGRLTDELTRELGYNDYVDCNDPPDSLIHGASSTLEH